MRALFLHTGALGDFILALRVVAALRGDGVSHVTLLGRPSIVSVALHTGLIDRVLDFEVGGFHALYTPDLPLPQPAQNTLQNHDLVLNMNVQDSQGILVRRLTETTSARVVDIDPRHRSDWTGHITDQWLADLAGFGFPSNAPPPRIEIPEPIKQATLEKFSIPVDIPFVLIHPGSGGRAKCWPIENFISVARTLTDNGTSVFFILGPVEQDLWPSDTISIVRSAAKLIENLTLIELSGILSCASGYVGNDSGVSHLAAIVGAPTIAIFGPTDPNIWGPLGETVHILGGDGAWPSKAVVRASLQMLG